MKRLSIALAIFCFAVSGNAQEEFVLPAARLLARFPFTQLSGGLLL